MAKFQKIWILCLVGLVLSAAKAEDNSNPEDYADDDGDYEDSSNAGPASITTEPKILEVDQGQTVQLPCRGENLPSVIWSRGSEILVAGELILSTDKRVNFSKTDLIIRNVTAAHAGKYTCKAATQAPGVDVTHTLKVYEQPRVSVKSASRVVKDGEPVTLTCDVTGVPEPTVTWERKGKRMPSGDTKIEGAELTFSSVSRHHTGVYECVAQNELGAARTAISLIVTHAPEIEVEKESVHSSKGYDAELVCIVHAEPKANVDWYKDGRPLDNSKHIKEERQKHYWVLHLKNIQQHDFGNYTCVATNTFGRSNKSIYLTEAPGQPILKEEYLGKDHLSYTVVYALESAFPVDECKIKFRKTGDDWQEIVPNVEKAQGHIYQVAHTFTDLMSMSDYEVTLAAHNQFGWSLESRPRKFHINGEYRSYEADAEPGAKEAIGSGSAGSLRPGSPLLRLSQISLALIIISLFWRRQ